MTSFRVGLQRQASCWGPVSCRGCPRPLPPMLRSLSVETAPLRHLLLFRVLHMRRLHMTKRRGAGGAAGAQRPQGEKQQGTSLNVSLKKRERLRHQNDRGAAEATERKCCAKE